MDKKSENKTERKKLYIEGDIIDDLNLKLMGTFCKFQIPLFLCLFIISFYLKSFSNISFIYLTLLLNATAFYWLFTKKLLNNKKWITVSMYVNISIILSAAVLIGTKYNLTRPATTFMAVMVISSVFVMATPKFFTFVCVSFVILFCILSIYLKSPSVWIVDCMNSIVFMLIAVYLNFILFRAQKKGICIVKHFEKQLETDSLTGIYNRKALQAFVDEYCKTQKEPSAGIILDIDRFKNINDAFGHQKGDNIIRESADILLNNFNNSSCVARMGGDEFFVFVPHVESREEILQGAYKTIKDFDRTISKDGKSVSISASIGICFQETTEKNMYNILYEKSDCALYMAKEMGKNGVCVYSDDKSENKYIKKSHSV